MHIHRFEKWEDVKVEEVIPVPPMSPFIAPVQVIKQQRRCSVCNLVKTRTSN